MDSEILRRTYTNVMDKLGPIAPVIEMAANSIVVPLRDGDIEGAKARAHELREAAAALDELGMQVETDLADNELDVAELAGIVELAARAVDEAEDVVTGVDEDDGPVVE